MKKFLLAALFTVIAVSGAFAQTMTTRVVSSCGTPGQTLNSGTSWFLTVDTNGNICGSFTPGTVTPGTFIGQVGGYNAIITNTPTVTAGAYSTSNAIGGWQQIAVFRSASQPSGIIDYVSVASKGGSTTALTIYAFNKSSANLTSTCTDKNAFALTAADLSALIPGFPVTLTPATTQGATITSASQSVVVSVKNADGTPSTNITLCAVVGGTVTPASTTDLVFNVALVQD